MGGQIKIVCVSGLLGVQAAENNVYANCTRLLLIQVKQSQFG